MFVSSSDDEAMFRKEKKNEEKTSINHESVFTIIYNR